MPLKIFFPLCLLVLSSCASSITKRDPAFADTGAPEPTAFPQQSKYQATSSTLISPFDNLIERSQLDTLALDNPDDIYNYQTDKRVSFLQNVDKCEDRPQSGDHLLDFPGHYYGPAALSIHFIKTNLKPQEKASVYKTEIRWAGETKYLDPSCKGAFRPWESNVSDSLSVETTELLNETPDEVTVAFRGKYPPSNKAFAHFMNETEPVFITFKKLINGKIDLNQPIVALRGYKTGPSGVYWLSKDMFFNPLGSVKPSPPQLELEGPLFGFNLSQQDGSKYCSSRGGHLPTAREFASYLVQFGAKGMQKDCVGSARCNFVQAAILNTNEGADEFAFSTLGYTSYAGLPEHKSVWTSSVLARNTDFGISFDGDGFGYDYFSTARMDVVCLPRK